MRLLTLTLAIAWTLLAPMLGAATQDILWSSDYAGSEAPESASDDACADFGEHVWSSDHGLRTHGLLAELRSEAEIEVDDSFNFSTVRVIRPTVDEPFTSGDDAFPSNLLIADRWGRAPPSCRGPPPRELRQVAFGQPADVHPGGCSCCCPARTGGRLPCSPL